MTEYDISNMVAAPSSNPADFKTDVMLTSSNLSEFKQSILRKISTKTLKRHGMQTMIRAIKKVHDIAIKNPEDAALTWPTHGIVQFIVGLKIDGLKDKKEVYAAVGKKASNTMTAAESSAAKAEIGSMDQWLYTVIETSTLKGTKGAYKATISRRVRKSGRLSGIELFAAYAKDFYKHTTPLKIAKAAEKQLSNIPKSAQCWEEAEEAAIEQYDVLDDLGPQHAHNLEKQLEWLKDTLIELKVGGLYDAIYKAQLETSRAITNSTTMPEVQVKDINDALDIVTDRISWYDPKWTKQKVLVTENKQHQQYQGQKPVPRKQGTQVFRYPCWGCGLPGHRKSECPTHASKNAQTPAGKAAQDKYRDIVKNRRNQALRANAVTTTPTTTSKQVSFTEQEQDDPYANMAILTCRLPQTKTYAEVLTKSEATKTPTKTLDDEESLHELELTDASKDEFSDDDKHVQTRPDPIAADFQAYVANAEPQNPELVVLRTILDSGANTHLIRPDTPHRVTSERTGHVTGLGGNEIHYHGTATAVINGIEIQDAIIVPDASQNIISVSKLASQNIPVTFTKDKATSPKLGTIAHKQEGLYVMSTRHINKSTTDPVVRLHRQLIHRPLTTTLNLIRTGQITTSVTPEALSALDHIDCHVCRARTSRAETITEATPRHVHCIGVDFAGPFTDPDNESTTLGVDLTAPQRPIGTLKYRLFFQNTHADFKHLHTFAVPNMDVDSIVPSLHKVVSFYTGTMKVKACDLQFKLDNFMSFHSRALKAECARLGMQEPIFRTPHRPQRLRIEQTNAFLDSAIRAMKVESGLPWNFWPVWQRRATILRNATNGHLHTSGKSSHLQIHGAPWNVDDIIPSGARVYLPFENGEESAHPGKHNNLCREGIYVGPTAWPSPHTSLVYCPDAPTSQKLIARSTSSLIVDWDLSRTSIPHDRIQRIVDTGFSKDISAVPRGVQDASPSRQQPSQTTNQMQQPQEPRTQPRLLPLNPQNRPMTRSAARAKFLAMGGTITSKPRQPQISQVSRSIEEEDTKPKTIVARNNEWFRPRGIDDALNAGGIKVATADPFLPGKADGYTRRWKPNVLINCPYVPGRKDLRKAVLSNIDAGVPFIVLETVSNSNWALDALTHAIESGKSIETIRVFGRIKFSSPNNNSGLRAPFDANLYAFNYPKSTFDKGKPVLLTNDGVQFELKWLMRREVNEIVRKRTEPAKSLWDMRKRKGNDLHRHIEALDKEIMKQFNADQMSTIERHVSRTQLEKEGWHYIPLVLVFKNKYDASGEFLELRCRTAADGRAQEEHLDFDPTKVRGPVATNTYIRAMLSLAASKIIRERQAGREINCHTLDVKGAYLMVKGHGGRRRLFGEIPYEVRDRNKGYRYTELTGNTYGLRAAGYRWGRERDAFLEKLGFIKMTSDDCMWKLSKGESWILTSVYVDDFLSVENDAELYRWFEKEMEKKWKLREKGKATEALSMRITEIIGDDGLKEGWLLDHSAHIERWLQEQRLEDIKERSIPWAKGTLIEPNRGDPTEKPFRKVLGYLSYLADTSMLDIAYPVRVLARCQANPSEEHWALLMQLTQYVKYRAKSRTTGMVYRCHDGAPLISGASDATLGTWWNRRSELGGFIRVAGNVVATWAGVQRVSPIADASAISELYAANQIAKKMMWVAKYVHWANGSSDERKPMPLMTDSMSLIHMGQRGSPLKRSRHVEMRWHHMYDLIEMGHIETKFIEGEGNAADMFTKVQTKAKLQQFSEEIQGATWARIARIQAIYDLPSEVEKSRRNVKLSTIQTIREARGEGSTEAGASNSEKGVG